MTCSARILCDDVRDYSCLQVAVGIGWKMAANSSPLRMEKLFVAAVTSPITPACWSTPSVGLRLLS